LIANKEILKTIVALEATDIHDAFKKNGLDFWPAIRIRLAFGLIEKQYKYRKKKWTFKSGLMALWDSVVLFSLKPQKVDILFITHDNYKVFHGGQEYDRVLEGLKIDCDENMETFAELNLATNKVIYSGNHGHSFSINGLLFILKIKVYLLTRLVNNSGVFEKVMEYINHHFQKAFPDHFIESISIRQHLIYIENLIKFFNRLLYLLGVKRVYQATYYDPMGLSINAAASQLGLTTYCVQHGGQSKNNPAFGQWSNMPLDGYDMLPSVFLCWDEGSGDAIKKWAQVTKKHSVKVIGYKWAELWRDGYIQCERYEQIHKLSERKLNVLYSMQPSIDGVPELIKTMVERFSERVNWWFRIHPRQLGTEVELDLEYEYKGYDNVLISEATENPLPALMVKMDLHLTCFSSCVYEAMMFNVPSIFIDDRGRQYFEDIISLEKAKLCVTNDELEKAIYERINDRIESSS